MKNVSRNKAVSIAALALAFFLLGWNAFGQGVTKTPQAPSPVVQTDQEQLRRLADAVTEVRRDQLNYQIERDLLKETYGSNLQTINLVLTIVLGAFAVIGYLGVRSIGTL